MATLVRKVFKCFLFIGLLILSVRYVHTYPQPMTENQLHWLLVICQKLGIHDPDNLYIPAMMVLEVIAAIMAYLLIMKLSKCIGAKRRDEAT
ncbi:hypothetical protein A6V36_17895 [Paraburkholderia ginsengiterrae]|uniref:Uncharacterized protein n=1 Tax=Paraburkholderia ginsengiterrae TaxID=1462993 RepID=A0A1A9MZ14_9BURK|nr:hypothetical protein A6V37_34795 [Paraburkholderia ginsengiterrae]OAJ63877.1 hypothetical protein A6V36_17895 [Paraburkholderia ginsengiterrae]